MLKVRNVHWQKAGVRRPDNRILHDADITANDVLNVGPLLPLGERCMSLIATGLQDACKVTKMQCGTLAQVVRCILVRQMLSAGFSKGIPL